MNRILFGLMSSVLVLTACAQPKPTEVALPAPSSTPSASSSIGYPPEPDAENRKTYLQTLNGIDKDIVHGKEQTAVNRGRNQCDSIKLFRNDTTKLITLTNDRFTSPNHPHGFGREKAAKILVAVHKYICPTY